MFTSTASFCFKVDATAAFLSIGWAIWLFVVLTLVYVIGLAQGDTQVDA
jgi:hypothetical protein